ncbi:MAG: OmpH family outer membrane protein [Bacteroidales bacterium]|mgnify:CR=1 FL=1|jgi:outer membrane protein|nr:OmpH family outer membrane protein [Bacteroidales bacterium]MDY0085054.1 OmpH family outer membrane protein [Bacteroidales bacterium]
MKNKAIVTLIVLMFAGLMSVQAQNQRFGYVDTEYILNNIPEYSDAQAELDVLSERWEKEIKGQYEIVEKMYRDYQTESVLLPEDMKRKREDEIIKKEQAVKDLQMKYFGPEGELFKKRNELVQPIQEKVFNAIQDIAETRNYAFVFDKAAGATMLYASDKFDISDDVLDEIGNVMQTVRREDRK